MVFGALQILKHLPGHDKAIEDIKKTYEKNEHKGD